MSVSANVTPIRETDEAAEVARPSTLPLIDPLLIVAALGLVGCSLVTLHGISRSLVERQAIYAGIGLLVAIVVARIDYSRLREYKLALYGLMLALNIVVFAMPTIRGAHRWIPLPLLQIQSSEFGKALLIVSLAAFAVDRARRLHERRTTARIMLLALIPAMVVIPQPDLGTGLVYVVIGFTMLVVGGTSWKQLTTLVAMFVASIAIVLAGAPALGVHVLKPYQVQRLTGFVNPSRDPQKQTYQIIESEIAIGSGGKVGRGVGHATQAGLGFLPAPDTDFIFAVVGETYGFVGAALVLSL
ncbi:MAG TPA: FtsW/RodA/SpoVE family cell cycle protein, partial [Solirubrobacteraceae bacterium]